MLSEALRRKFYYNPCNIYYNPCNDFLKRLVGVADLQQQISDMKYLEVLNKEKKEATIRLYGSIGDEINGNEFAYVLAQIDNQADVVNLRINSPGGSVYDGLSIVSAMLSMKARINVYVDGIAASMAAVIAVCGDTVYMMDFAKLMIHDPFIPGDQALSEKDKKGLQKITDILRTILSRRGNKEIDIAALMQKETWFSAQEALTEGLIDEIVSSKRKDLSGKSPEDIQKIILNEYKPIKPQKKMNDEQLKALAKLLGLPENSEAAAVIVAITALKTEKESLAKRLLDHYQQLGRNVGIITDDNAADFEALAASNFDLYAKMVSGKPQVQPAPATQPQAQTATRLSQALQGLGTGGERKDTKTYDWYQKNDPQALIRLERENPTEFKKLLDDYENGL